MCQCGVGRTEQSSVLDSGCLPEEQYEINTSPSYTWGSWPASNATTGEEPSVCLQPARCTLILHMHTLTQRGRQEQTVEVPPNCVLIISVVLFCIFVVISTTLLFLVIVVHLLVIKIHPTSG